MVTTISTASTASPALTSILMPCCGMLEFTKLCVPSVLRNTRTPIELIFLDIGSLDGTAEYLQGLKAGTSHRVEVVRTPTDLGIGEACKEALSRARGDFLVLLNNDTVLTAGWLQQLLGLAAMSPAIGLVGPMSNYAAPPQLVEEVPYRLGAPRGDAGISLDVNAVEHFAAELREKQRGKWMETTRLGGFCLLAKREVLTKIGPLATAGDLNLFDTDVLCAKAHAVGYTLAVCRDLFVHHFGTRTFAQGAASSEGA